MAKSPQKNEKSRPRYTLNDGTRLAVADVLVTIALGMAAAFRFKFRFRLLRLGGRGFKDYQKSCWEVSGYEKKNTKFYWFYWVHVGVGFGEALQKHF